ncbi:hypothetical protein WH47_09168 [Habropoda laboriosa]|uniref:HAT C-terminal dimerisation domain-containing protein n=1 Tax=Habropoda laboriosa TaxID=597456 RepID=A0A0L7QN29_9HYME|nr:hypothetical protein WH47_09168 [Habropoda laboriosa]
MWIDICTQKNSSQNFLFPHLSSLLSTVRCLPHSNAESERIFSMLPDIKSKKRNKIGVDLLNSMRVVRTSLKARGDIIVKSPFEFTIPPHKNPLHMLGRRTRETLNS